MRVRRVSQPAVLGSVVLSLTMSGCALLPNNLDYHIPDEENDAVLPVPEFARPEAGAPEAVAKAETPPRSAIGHVGHFLENRFNDLSDIFGVGILVGQGALLNVRATRYAQIGIEYAEAARLGFNGRETGIWSQQTSGGGAFRYRVWVDEVSAGSNTTDFHGIATEDAFPHRGATDFGLTAMLPIGLGIDVKVDPALSLIDFLGGFVGLDPAHDDAP